MWCFANAPTFCVVNECKQVSNFICVSIRTCSWLFCVVNNFKQGFDIKFLWYFADSPSVSYTFTKSVANGVAINVANIVSNAESKINVDSCGTFYDYDPSSSVENPCTMSTWKVTLTAVLSAGALVGGILLAYRLYRMKVLR